MLNIEPKINSTSYSYNRQAFGLNPYFETSGGAGQVGSSPAETIGSAAIMQIIAMSLASLSQWCSAKLKMSKNFAEPDIIKNIAMDMAKKNNLQITLGYVDEANKHLFEQKFNAPGMFESVAKGSNAFYQDRLKLAVAPKNKPYLILHEIGHGINSTKGKFMRFLQNSRFKLASLPTALIIANMFCPRSSEDGKTFIERNAGKIGFAAFLPTIAEEGLASLRGIKAAAEAKKIYGNKINLAPLKKNYFIAWMTYLISGVLLGISMKQTMLETK